MKTMMQRFSERVDKELNAELILNNGIYNVTIENFAENGVKIRTLPKNTAEDISSEETIVLEFKILSGEILSLHCQVKWLSKRSSDSIIEEIGLEITGKSPKYEDFYQSLVMNDMLYL